jgi:hypothetical protein
MILMVRAPEKFGNHWSKYSAEIHLARISATSIITGAHENFRDDLMTARA